MRYQVSQSQILLVIFYWFKYKTRTGRTQRQRNIILFFNLRVLLNIFFFIFHPILLDFFGTLILIVTLLSHKFVQTVVTKSMPTI